MVGDLIGSETENNDSTIDVSGYQYVHAEAVGGDGEDVYLNGGDGAEIARYLAVGETSSLQIVSGEDNLSRTGDANALGSSGDGGIGDYMSGGGGGTPSGVVDDDTGDVVLIAGGGGGGSGRGGDAEDGEGAGGGGGGGFPGGSGGDNGTGGSGSHGEDAETLAGVSDVGGDGGEGGDEDAIPNQRSGTAGADGETWTDGGYIEGTASFSDASTGVRVYEVDEDFWGSQPVPENVVAEPGARGEIDLSWDAVTAADEYTIYEDGAAVATTTNTSYTRSGLTDGNSYAYEVTAIVDGAETAGNTASATTSLLAPTLDSVTADGREIGLEWTIEDNSSAGTLVIHRNGAAVETLSSLGDESHTDTGLDDGREYEYQLERDTGDATATSGVATATTALPPAQALIVEETDGRRATLSWTDPSNNASGYRLLLREDDTGDYAQDGDDIPPVSEGETQTVETSELLDGQLYGATVETFTEDATAREDQ